MDLEVVSIALSQLLESEAAVKCHMRREEAAAEKICFLIQNSCLDILSPDKLELNDEMMCRISFLKYAEGQGGRHGG